MRASFLTLAAVGLLATSARADDGALPGTLSGAAAGGLIGSSLGHGDGRFAATAAGVVIGGLAGNAIGQSYDNAGTYNVAYNNAQPGTYYDYPYDMFPSPAFYQPYEPNYVAPPGPPPPITYVDSGSGDYCREFSQQVRMNGRIQEAYGTACLQPDGSWHIAQ